MPLDRLGVCTSMVQVGRKLLSYQTSVCIIPFLGIYNHMVVASSGVSALLLKNCQMAHTAVKVPLNLNNSSRCLSTLEDKCGRILKALKFLVCKQIAFKNKLVIRWVDSVASPNRRPVLLEQYRLLSLRNVLDFFKRLEFFYKIYKALEYCFVRHLDSLVNIQNPFHSHTIFTDLNSA